jgi:hypothetical protein
MYSPRKKSFYMDLANSIRTERMLKEKAREEITAELRALHGRLLRLQKWEQLLENPSLKEQYRRRVVCGTM